MVTSDLRTAEARLPENCFSYTSPGWKGNSRPRVPPLYPAESPKVTPPCVSQRPLFVTSICEQCLVAGITFIACSARDSETRRGCRPLLFGCAIVHRADTTAATGELRVWGSVETEASGTGSKQCHHGATRCWGSVETQGRLRFLRSRHRLICIPLQGTPRLRSHTQKKSLARAFQRTGCCVA